MLSPAGEFAAAPAVALPRIVLAVAAAVFAVGAGRPIWAQQMQGCESHERIGHRLKAKFHEDLASVATNQYGWLIELFTSPDGKTWTLVATRPNGPSCVFGVGRDWQVVQPTSGNPM